MSYNPDICTHFDINIAVCNFLVKTAMTAVIMMIIWTIHDHFLEFSDLDQSKFSSNSFDQLQISRLISGDQKSRTGVEVHSTREMLCKKRSTHYFSFFYYFYRSNVWQMLEIKDKKTNCKNSGLFWTIQWTSMLVKQDGK